VANFTILEQDPYAVEVDALKDIPVWGVVFEGQKVEAPKEVAQGRGTTFSRVETNGLDLVELGRSRG
jgi:hypothetical protein